jgi:mevalonate kinase
VDIPLKDLPDVLEQMHRRHRDFRDGHLAISEVVDSPEQLLAATAALAHPQSGASLHVQSQLPLGSGLGSSAACILALLKALQPQWEQARLFETAVHAESFQHGSSSGLDVATSLYGGLIHYHDSNFDSLFADTHLPSFRVYNSGRPESSTGECVSAVSNRFPSSDPIWSDFREVTQTTLTCLQDRNVDGWHNCVSKNHQLLCHIGVVPLVIQDHIASLEQSGFAVKICGAGSLRGDRAGMILVCGDGTPPVPDHWQEMNFGLSEKGTILVQEAE